MSDREGLAAGLDPPRPGLGRRILAEAIGTALLVLFGAGAVVAARAVDHVPGSYPALGFVALAFGAAVTLAILVFGGTSGAHINPAVTLALAVFRWFPWRDVGPYIAAQLTGAGAGAAGIVVIFGAAPAGAARVGATTLGDGVSFVGGVAAETLGTFLLMLTLTALAVDPRARPGVAGPGIGLAVTTEILLIGPLTGGSVNPARTFGPYLVTTLLDADTPWAQFPVYLMGPVLGSILGTGAYVVIARPPRALTP
jgi:glycerol uptake facilitator protein